jgi:hypothetical protein
MLAALAAIARANPSLIRNMIKDNGDGTYNVTLYIQDNFWSSRSPKVVKVKSTFPANNGNPAYSQIGDRGKKGPELWVMLIEKAYAMSKGGYDDIEGGFGGPVIRNIVPIRLMTIQKTNLLQKLMIYCRMATQLLLQLKQNLIFCYSKILLA